jgi:hypothetical protein
MSDIDFTGLRYDPTTGIFVWSKSPARVIKAGTVAGRLGRDGYIAIQIKGRLYFAHRLAWLYVNGVWPKNQIDHINGNRSDNRIENLREATRKQNGENRRVVSTTRSGKTGVTWNERYGVWYARIMHNKKPIHLGAFKNLDAAIAVRVAAEQSMFTHCPPH